MRQTFFGIAQRSIVEEFVRRWGFDGCRRVLIVIHWIHDRMEDLFTDLFVVGLSTGVERMERTFLLQGISVAHRWLS